MIKNKGMAYDIKNGSSLSTRKNKSVFMITTKKEVEAIADSTICLIPHHERILTDDQERVAKKKERYRKKAELKESKRETQSVVREI